VNGFAKTLKVFGLFVYGLFVFAMLSIGLAAVGAGPGVVVELFLLFLMGWAVYAYLRYREGRQAEFLQLLMAAVAAGMPLVPAVQAYRDERPVRSEHWAHFGWFVASITVLLLPVWMWLRARRFDRRIEQFAEKIENGASLSEALRAVPDVASRETRLAAAVGEATGTLASSLRRADRERVGAAWLEVAPRLLYPFIVFLFVLGITAFLMITIVPRYRRIMYDFGQQLPAVTQGLVDAWYVIEDWLPEIFLGWWLAIFGVAALIASPTVRWYLPLLGRLYRWDVQGQVLRALGRMLGAEMTVPESLWLLTHAAELPPVVQRRLANAAVAVKRGDELDDALRGAGLLPAAMAPLVRAAGRARTLPWALAELGDYLGGRAFRLVRRLSLVIGPVLVVAIGVVVGFVVLSMFTPLIQLLTWLST
jgi:type IV pilus assembly protein PilC